MFAIVSALLRYLLSWLRRKHELALENLALQHQIAVLNRQAHNGMIADPIEASKWFRQARQQKACLRYGAPGTIRSWAPLGVAGGDGRPHARTTGALRGLAASCGGWPRTDA